MNVESPAALGANVRRRLVTIAKSRSVLPYDKGRELIAELDGLRTTIIETIGAKDPELGFLDLHPTILERIDYSSGALAPYFEWRSTISGR